MGKTLVITEKKSVADDFARVLGSVGGSGTEGRSFHKSELFYESDDLIIAWASGHLLELQDPGEYDKAWRYWRLDKLPIVPETFVHVPRGDDKKTSRLLKNLVKLIRRDDVDKIINGCDAGREGELIFNLILDHARSGSGKSKAEGKPVERLWLQSMTAASIRESFRELKPANAFRSLREAAYTRDQADWLVGMNGTRALTKRFLGGRNRVSLAVGRVKTPTLAFLVDREREIDNFIPVPYYEIHATFSVDPSGRGGEESRYESRWTGKDAEGKTTDRILDRAAADDIVSKIKGQLGEAKDTVRRSKEKPPQLFDLTTLQRRASSSFGFTLKRTLSIAQTLYEAKKAITYPRTGSRYLPDDYRAEVPRIFDKLADSGYEVLASKVPNRSKPDSERKGMVFDDKKVGDHFALIPTGEIPKSLRPDEKKVYDMIVRRFFAAFMPSAERETTTRRTEVAGEAFKSTARKLIVAGWRAAEPIAADDKPFPELDEARSVLCVEPELTEKETSPPSRYTDGTLVGEMETCGKHVENEEEAEALKDVGIGTPATRAAIVEDLIYKRLARRDGRTLVPTALGSTLVRVVRNLQLDTLAKPDMTGEWEQRLRGVTEGDYDAEEFRQEIIKMVEGLVNQVKSADDGAAVFGADHPDGLTCPKCGSPIIEKAYSYFCSDEDGCGVRIHKDVGGKHVFPEILGRLVEAAKKEETVGPLTGFERPKAPCKLALKSDGLIVLEPEGDIDFEQPETYVEEQVPDGVVMGKCPKCGSDVKAEGTGYVCEKRPDGCNFRLSKKLLFRELPPADVKLMLSGPERESRLIEGFISRRGRPFAAQLFFDEKGALKWKFPERKKKATKKKAGKKKAKKKKKTAAKKKTTRKKAATE